MRKNWAVLAAVLLGALALSVASAQNGQQSQTKSSAAKKREQPEGTFFNGLLPPVVNGKLAAVNYQLDVGGYGLDAPPDKDRSLPYDHHRMMGVWEIIPATNLGATISTRVPPMTAMGKEMLLQHKPGGGPRVVWSDINDPELTCDVTGWPRVVYSNARPVEFIQLPDRELQHWVWHDAWRTIYTDGRLLPKDPDPTWWGYSVGKWVGETFVADTTGENDRTWLDHLGDPHSVNAMIHESWHRLDHNTLQMDLTVTDPEIYTETWVGDPKLFEYYPHLDADSLPCIASEEISYGSLFEGPDSKGNPSTPSVKQPQ